MNMRAIIILVLLGLLSNEHFIPKKFSSLLVDTGSDNPQLNKQIIEQFNNIGVTAVNSLDLFPRVHTLDMEDLRAIYSKFDGAIQFTVKGISVHTDAAKVPSPRMDFEVSLTDVPTDSLVVLLPGATMCRTTTM